MNKKLGMIVMVLSVAFLWAAPGIASSATGGEPLRYSQAAQVYAAFGKEVIELFQEKTGVAVESSVYPSPSALYRLMNDFADIASTSRQLYSRHKEKGYVEIPFCKDPLAVIVHPNCPVEGISSDQLQEVFSGDITNWQLLGGPDAPIVVVVPGHDTGANQNFRRQVMKHKDIVYDIMTYQSTTDIQVIEKFPWSISFIARGAMIENKGVKVLKIDGLSPGDPQYPYYQMFSFVTHGEPSGPAKAFVDFVFSIEVQNIIRRKGMVPIAPTP